MNIPNHRIDTLTAFIKKDKFNLDAWSKRGLNSSDNRTCEHLQTIFNDIAEDLKTAISANKKHSSLQSILKSGLKRFSKSDYDTEEKEFICDMFTELAVIVEIDFSSNLNKFLYGALASTFIQIEKILNPEKIVHTLQQPCVKCETGLETNIKKIEEGIPDTNWFIVRCNYCKELNLLTLEPNIKELKFGNYELIENLFKEDYSYDQAIMRLDQIKLYRKQ